MDSKGGSTLLLGMSVVTSRTSMTPFCLGLLIYNGLARMGEGWEVEK